MRCNTYISIAQSLCVISLSDMNHELPATIMDSSVELKRCHNQPGRRCMMMYEQRQLDGPMPELWIIMEHHHDGLMG